jgi:acetyl esterase/lipase
MAVYAQLNFSDNDQEDRSVRVVRDIPYDVHNTRKGNLLDLYLPLRMKEPLPLVVWIHGGGWITGDKNIAPFALLTQRGFAVASINYRLSKEAKFPAQIQDCSAALKWLNDHASDYGIDANRIGVWGASAGGHLASLIGTARDAHTPGWANALSQSAKNVKAVCDWNGPTDLLTIISKEKNSGLAGMVFDFLPEKSVDTWAIEASPITYVTPTNLTFLIVHGDKDDVVPLEQSKKLSEMLKAKGVHCTLTILPGAGHVFATTEILNQAIQFFEKTLK